MKIVCEFDTESKSFTVSKDGIVVPNVSYFFAESTYKYEEGATQPTATVRCGYDQIATSDKESIAMRYSCRASEGNFVESTDSVLNCTSAAKILKKLFRAD